MYFHVHNLSGIPKNGLNKKSETDSSCSTELEIFVNAYEQSGEVIVSRCMKLGKSDPGSTLTSLRRFLSTWSEHDRPVSDPEVGNFRELLLQATYLIGDLPALLVEWHSRRILACNAAVKRLFGYTPAELTGQTTHLLHATQKQFDQFGEDSEIHMVVGSSTYRGHLWMQRRDGTLLPTENLAQLIRDEAGHPYAGLSLIRDL